MAFLNRFTTVLVICISFGIKTFLQLNPMFLFGLNKGLNQEELGQTTIYRNGHPVLDYILNLHKDALGDDYDPYQNHCLRVLTFAEQLYKNSINTEDSTSDFEASSSYDHDMSLMAYAIAYHDIGLWVSDDETSHVGKLNYLEPSVKVMEQDLELLRNSYSNHNDKTLPSNLIRQYTSYDLETARQIILQHHKYTQWSNPKEKDDTVVVPANAQLVNAVRKGDWIDFTYGIIRFRNDLDPISNTPVISEELLQETLRQIPELGFHRVLLGMGKRISPNSFIKQLDVLKIFKW